LLKLLLWLNELLLLELRLLELGLLELLLCRWFVRTIVKERLVALYLNEICFSLQHAFKTRNLQIRLRLIQTNVLLLFISQETELFWLLERLLLGLGLQEGLLLGLQEGMLLGLQEGLLLGLQEGLLLGLQEGLLVINIIKERVEAVDLLLLLLWLLLLLLLPLCLTTGLAAGSEV